MVGSSILPSGTFRYGLGLRSSGGHGAPLHWFDHRSHCPFFAAFARAHCDHKAARWSVENRGEERGANAPRGAGNRTLPKIEEESETRHFPSFARERAAPKAFGVGREFDSPLGTFCHGLVYILKGGTGAHYIGSTVDPLLVWQHLRGTLRLRSGLGGALKIVARKR